MEGACPWEPPYNQGLNTRLSDGVSSLSCWVLAQGGVSDQLRFSESHGEDLNLEREGQPVQMRQQSLESRPQPFPTFLPGQNLRMEPNSGVRRGAQDGAGLSGRGIVLNQQSGVLEDRIPRGLTGRKDSERRLGM